MFSGGEVIIVVCGRRNVYRILEVKIGKGWWVMIMFFWKSFIVVIKWCDGKNN